MPESLQKRNTASWLLANRDRLSLEKAANYLVGRIRTRSPLGACEFLVARDPELAPDVYDVRVALARRKMELYESLFPREYGQSQSPPFSLQREQEFYHLVSNRLFPLDLEMLDKEPTAFLRIIPIEGTQEHDWIAGCCGFEKLQLMFKLVLTLSGRREDGWRLLGLEKAPAPPLDAPGWTVFTYALAVDPTPLRHLVHAFNLTCYSTGNLWLDVPKSAMGRAGMEWNAHNLGRLYIDLLRANQINLAVKELEEWLQQDPKARVNKAVELWNAAAATAARPDGRRVYVGQDGRQMVV